MGGMQTEKEWEIRRLASKTLHTVLTEAGNLEEARLVAALCLSILLNPAPMPTTKQAADLVKLVVCS